jgi:hypothetical protein
MAPPLLHTPEEAAEMLRCTASWLKEKARLREVPFTLMGGAYRFTDAHLAWIIAHFEQLPEQQHTQPTAAPGRPRRTTAAKASPGTTQLKARRPRRLRSAS